MRRTEAATWPTSRRKRLQRRRYGPAPTYTEPPMTTHRMAVELVRRGLASVAILGPMRRPWEDER